MSLRVLLSGNRHESVFGPNALLMNDLPLACVGGFAVIGLRERLICTSIDRLIKSMNEIDLDFDKKNDCKSFVEHMTSSLEDDKQKNIAVLKSEIVHLYSGSCFEDGRRADHNHDLAEQANLVATVSRDYTVSIFRITQILPEICNGEGDFTKPNSFAELDFIGILGKYSHDPIVKVVFFRSSIFSLTSRGKLLVGRFGCGQLFGKLPVNPNLSIPVINLKPSNYVFDDGENGRRGSSILDVSASVDHMLFLVKRRKYSVDRNDSSFAKVKECKESIPKLNEVAHEADSHKTENDIETVTVDNKVENNLRQLDNLSRGNVGEKDLTSAQLDNKEDVANDPLLSIVDSHCEIIGGNCEDSPIKVEGLRLALHSVLDEKSSSKSILDSANSARAGGRSSSALNAIDDESTPLIEMINLSIPSSRLGVTNGTSDYSSLNGDWSPRFSFVSRPPVPANEYDDVGKTTIKSGKWGAKERAFDEDVDSMFSGDEATRTDDSLSSTNSTLNTLSQLSDQETNCSHLSRAGFDRVDHTCIDGSLTGSELSGCGTMKCKLSQDYHSRPGIAANVTSSSSPSGIVRRSSSRSVGGTGTGQWGIDVFGMGKNEHGQLGLGDRLDRDEPVLVEALCNLTVIKVCTGSCHSAVLTASGDVFVYGSNACGQVKQVAVENTTVPVKCKLGSKTAALDVACGRDFTMVMVRGLNSYPDLYYWGRDYNSESEDSTQSTTLRLGDVVKLGRIDQILSWPDMSAVAVHLVSVTGASLSASFESGILKMVDMTSAEMSFISRLSEFVSFMTDISELTREQFTEEESTLLSEYCNCLAKFSTFHLRFVTCLRRTILSIPATTTPNASFYRTKSDTPSNLTKCSNPMHNDVSMKVMAEIGSRAYAACYRDLCALSAKVVVAKILKELTLVSDVDQWFARFQKICLENDVEMAKPSRALRYLMRIPFLRMKNYANLCSDMAEISDNDKQAKAFKMLNGHFQALDDHGNRVSRLAELTYRFWAANPTLADSFRQSKRLFVSDYTKGTHLTAVAIDGYGKGFSRVLLFTDALVILLRNSNLLYPVSILWHGSVAVSDGDSVTGVTEDTSLTLIHPESEIKLDFVDAQTKNKFWIELSTCIHEVAAPCPQSAISTPGQPPARRHATHIFTNKHPLYPGASYTGYWKCGKCWGRGEMIWTDGRWYNGSFVDGKLDGPGEMKIQRGPGSRDVLCGTWRDNKLEGVALILYANKSRYEGYVSDGQKHGHGVYSTMLTTYVGQWAKDEMQGYGVMENGPREKYLGMWLHNLYHGTGVLVTLDGVYYAGTFDRGKFVKGRMVTNDGIAYEGEFDGIHNFYGKGTMQYPGGDQLVGTFYGNFTDSVKIAGTLKRSLDSPMPRQMSAATGSFVLKPTILRDAHLSEIEILSGDEKWSDMFDQFYADLKVFPNGSEPVCTAKMWEGIAAAQEQLRAKLMPKDSSAQLDVLTVVPDFNQPFSKEYLASVKRFWNAAIANPHPIAHLFKGLCDVFAMSYNAVSAHPLMLAHAVDEAKSLIRRLYGILRYLYPSLLDLQKCNTPHLMESGCFEDSLRNNFDPSTIHIRPSTLQFVTDSFISCVYPTLFTMFVMHHSASDSKYWKNISILSSKNSLQLMHFLEISRILWPVQLQTLDGTISDELDSQIEKEYFKDAIDCFQKLGSEFSPFQKLMIIVETFKQIKKYMDRYMKNGGWGADVLHPIVLYVVVKSKIQHLGAELLLLYDFVPYVDSLGEVGVMLTIISASYSQVVEERRF